jgi:ABC-type glycerol-3-phosphate transport system substrate-binding protein
MTSEDTHGDSRRKFMKTAAVGALGALAGCSGGDGGGDGGDGGDGGATDTPTDSDGGGGDGGDDTTTAGEAEPVEISYWSSDRTHNPTAREWFPNTIDKFEENFSDENVTINLTTYAPGDLTEKIQTAVQQGNPPGMAGATETFWREGTLYDVASYWDEYPELSNTDNAPASMLAAAKYRGAFMGGPDHTTPITTAVVPKWFKEVGYEPEDLTTWTGFRRALEDIKSDTDVEFAYEETGTKFDLETYWGQARTAYTDGTDPWMDVVDEGSPSDPVLKIGEEPATDGMIHNCLDLADNYSSPNAASRGDEEIPNMFFTDRVASMTYGVGGFQRYQTVKEDATFGWDGDVYEFADPKLDPNYGDEFGDGTGMSQLAGIEGERGGHMWAGALGQFKQGLPDTQRHHDMGWNWNLWLDTSIISDWHIPRWYGFAYPRAISWFPAYDAARSYMEQELGNVPQVWDAGNTAMQEWADQFQATGQPWDVGGRDEIRWNNINGTISETMAGQHDRSEVVSLIRERVETTLSEQNQ